MKKILSTLVLIFTLSLLADTVEVFYSFDEPQVQTKDEFSVIKLKDTKLSGISGEPVMPYKAVSLLVPAGHKAVSMNIELSEPEKISGKYKIYPYQPSRPVSSGKSGSFTINNELYETKSVYPAEKSGVLTTQYLSGHAIAMTTFTPIEYIPSTGEVTIYKKAKVTIQTEVSSNSQKALKNLRSDENTLRRVKNLIDNKNDLGLYPKKAKDNDYELALITKEEFTENFTPLVSHYQYMGIKSEIITVESIYQNYTGVDNPEKIRNFIIDAYQNHGLVYAVLAGDVEVVPYRGFFCEVQSSSVMTDDGIPSDLYFSGIDGNWNTDGDNLWGEIGEDDLLPEVSIGRLSVSNVSDIETFVNKINLYTGAPVLGELDKPFLVGEHLYDNPTTWGADYLELLVGTANVNGYETTGIPETDNYEELYDRDYGTWGTSTLFSKINEGKSFIHHSGHSNYNYAMRLYNSDITNSNFSQVNGIDHNYTLVYSHGCICGAFDNDDCIAERMVNIDNFAVSVVMNSRYGWFNEGQTEGPSFHIHREFMDALYGDKTYMLGTAHLESKIDTAPWVNAPGQHEEGALRWCFYDCNIIGDPALPIWTANPVAANIETSALIFGVSTQEVEVTVDGTHQADVTVIITQNEEVLGSGKTNEQGVASIELEDLGQPGELNILVKGNNILPNEQLIPYVSGSTPFVIVQQFNVNGNQTAPAGENFSFDIDFFNTGTVATTGVSGTLSCENENVEILDNSVSIGDLGANATVNIADVFDVKITGLEDQEEVTFDVLFDHGSGAFNENSFDVVIDAPMLSAEFVGIDDTQSGNGNGTLDPGETAVLYYDITNNGHLDALADLTLTAVSPTTVNSGIYNDVSIPIGETVQKGFEITVFDEVTAGFEVELTLAAETDALNFSFDFTNLVGIIIEDFESGNFGNGFSWTHSGDENWEVLNQLAYEGAYCAGSGNISHDDNSILEVEVDCIQSGEIKFFGKVSSEEDYDYLYFYIDGEQELELSGDVDWTEYSYTVDLGVHTFKWEYSKDGSVSSNDDKAYIDFITFPPMEGSVSIGNNDITPVVTELIGNYPNPFNPNTNIKFNLSDAAKVEIRLYNVKGEFVQSILNQDMLKGSHKVEFNAEGLNSGVYFYTLKTNNYKNTKKMLLVK